MNITKTVGAVRDLPLALGAKAQVMGARAEGRLKRYLRGAALVGAGSLASTASFATGVNNAFIQKYSTDHKFDTLVSNVDHMSAQGGEMIMNLIAIGGFVLIAIGLYQLYKASKDEREKPLSALAGILVGGAMMAAGGIAWMVRNGLLAGTNL